MSAPYCCPFCGLLCDDLGADQPGCARARQLSAVPDRGQALVDGHPASLADACRAAAGLLGRARRPLIGGLACEVQGLRAALALAERLGGVVDHMNGEGQFRNWRAFQSSGWMSTSLSEVRNHADLLVLAGCDGHRFPRLFERCYAPDSQFGPRSRRLIVLGAGLALPQRDGGGQDRLLPVPIEHLGTLFAALRTRLAGRTLRAETVAGLTLAELDVLLAELRAARYGVLAWNAAELGFAGADLAIEALLDLVRDLNAETRWSGLPLGGNDGDCSAAQVCTWQTGYPLRVAYDADGPRYEPELFAGDELLARGEVDALLWIDAFDPARAPLDPDPPCVLLGRPDTALTTLPAVFIPVAVPGVQQGGFLHRMDGVVALPLSAPRPAGLPGVAEVLAAIQKELDRAAA